MQYSASTTLLEAVKKSLENAGRYNSGDVVAPAAILWADPDRQWQSLVVQLFPVMPELFILGEYNKDKRTGPAIWLRCVVDHTIENINIPDNKIPVIYMPGASRQDLRAGEECPNHLKPLVELQFRGTLWMQRNGRDWTMEAFLISEDGLNLDVARDAQTRISMLRSLEQLAVTPLSRLWGKKLEAEDFDKLMIGDTARDILAWMNQPKEIKEKWDANKWAAFCSRCKADYYFNPENEGELDAAEKLGLQRDDAWKGIWLRFKEAPVLYPNIGFLLKRAKPAGEILFDKEPWPDENEQEENSLRKALLTFDTLNSNQSRQLISDLEKTHADRRSWVWAQLGNSSLALALQHLAFLAQLTVTSPGGNSIEDILKGYVDQGWQVDWAMLQALNSVTSAEDKKAVITAIRSLYIPWLEQATTHFQQCVLKSSYTSVSGKLVQHKIPAKTCWLFVDGLRYDLAQRLKTILENHHLQVSNKYGLSALPSVTATSKPAISPLSSLFEGITPKDDFNPVIKESKQPLNTERFRKLLKDQGIQYLDSADCGDAVLENAIAWSEWGEFDKLGHALGIGLAARIDDQLSLLLERIEGLLKAGWENVHLVTDHGWLLVPGGCPKIDLPKYLVQSRWARCAIIQDNLQLDAHITQWYWNSQELFAFAPGIHCFSKGQEFAHGGVSLQECVIPDMVITSGQQESKIVINIKSVQWVGLRCRIIIDPVENVKVDLRTRANDPASSLTTPKEVDSEGNVSLLVGDESLEGTVTSLVILDFSGHIITKQVTTVGGEK